MWFFALLAGDGLIQRGLCVDSRPQPTATIAKGIEK